MNESKILKSSLYIIFSFLILSAGSCAHGVKYVSQTPPSIEVPKSRQPVTIQVLDKRKSVYVSQLAEGEEHRGALNPDQLRIELSENPQEKVRNVINEYLVGRNVGVSMDPGPNDIVCELRYFDVEFEENTWKAKVVMTLDSAAKNQFIEASFNKVNKSGNYDGEVAISTALSMVIDKIDWAGLLPVVTPDE